MCCSLSRLQLNVCLVLLAVRGCTARMLRVKALDAAERLGVARLLNADDMLLLVVPDKLNVMTFVYQLRAQLTGCTVSAPSLASSPTTACSSLQPTSTDWLANLCPLTATERQAVESRYSAASHHADASSLAQTGRQLLACTRQSSELAASLSDRLQPASQTNAAALMTRQQLLNPFDSDSDSEPAASAPSDAPRSADARHDDCGVSAAGECSDDAAAQSRDVQCSRRDQLRERARALLQQVRHDAGGPATTTPDDDRRRRLRERARRLIAESRAAPAVTQVITVHSRKTMSTPLPPPPPAGEMFGGGSALQQRHAASRLACLTDDQSSSVDEPGASYAEVEMELLERSLARLDERAAGVEWSLRRVMDSQRRRHDDDADAQQQRLVYEWFALVDERSELVRRIEQLNAVAQEHDLERRFELLSVELRRLMSDGGGGETGDAAREHLLLAELMTIVNQRDALVQQLDRQEQASAKPHHAENTSRRDSACSVQ